MKFNFKNQPETVQAVTLGVVSIIFLAGIWLIINAVKSPQVETSSNNTVASTTVATTTVSKDTNEKKSTSNTVSLGGYAQGIYTGYIRNLSKINGYSFTVDFVESLSGKEAFLAAAAEASKKPQYNWDMMKDRFPTYVQLAKGIRALTNLEFESLYYSYATQLGDNRSGILTAFPNGFYFIRNTSTAVRIIAADKKLGSVSVSGSSTQINLEDLYLICQKPTPAILDMFYRKYSTPVSCQNPVKFTISKGKVVAVEIVSQP